MNRVVMLLVLTGFLVLGNSMVVAAQPESPRCRVKADPLFIGGSSFLIPGLGQFLNGEDAKGFVHLLVAAALPASILVIGMMIGSVSPMTGSILMVAAPLIYLAWAAHSAVDAYNVSSSLCRL